MTKPTNRNSLNIKQQQQQQQQQIHNNKNKSRNTRKDTTKENNNNNHHDKPKNNLETIINNVNLFLKCLGRRLTTRRSRRTIKTRRMSHLLRVAVSKQKRRYQKNGFDLDLAYITDRIIAMGFPSEKVEGVFRNPMKEVIRFLDQYHKDHYKVYNLCSERDYDHNKFYGRVGCYPFDDHNAPQFELIEAFCKDVDAWMKEDPKNIAVIHCKAGKGRTGLMICCWLLYCGMWKETEESLSFYAALRTYNQKGVTIPSQIRYVHYFGRSLKEKITFPRALLLHKLILKPLPLDANLSEITFNICVGKTSVYHSRDVLNVTVHRVDTKKKKPLKKSTSKKDLKKDGSAADLSASRTSPNEPRPVVASLSKGSSGQIKSQLDHTQSMGSLSSSTSFDYQQYYQNMNKGNEDHEEYISFDIGTLPLTGDIRVEVCEKNERMFMFWFNTSFVATTESIPKKGLDKAHKDKNHKKYPENFRVELCFDEIPASAIIQPNGEVGQEVANAAPHVTNITAVVSTNSSLNGNTSSINQKDETDSESDSSDSDDDVKNKDKQEQQPAVSTTNNVTSTTTPPQSPTIMPTPVETAASN